MEKFKPKLTTDDCYTPENIQRVVEDWVAEEYGLNKKNFVRPFWPGADYQAMEYKEDCVVVDNPPFSILSKIAAWYTERNIKFFLYAPALTMFGSAKSCCAVCAYGTITYQNGAEVNTGFVTNLDPARIRTAPELVRRLEEANKENVQKQKKHPPKYSFPPEIVTAALMGKWSKYGVDFRVMPEECAFVRKLDAMDGKEIFGGGYLLSERAAAERAAAERAAAERAAAERAAATVWELSQREKDMARKLGR